MLTRENSKSTIAVGVENMKKYQLKDGDKWVTCRKAFVNAKGWLEWELLEGKGMNASTVTGLSGPSKKGIEWREKPERAKK